jgi:hypothetical protein
MQERRRRMNERVRELKEQATRTAMWPGDPDAGELDAEKFAKLIVQECLKECQSEMDCREIRKKFGVEE